MVLELILIYNRRLENSVFLNTFYQLLHVHIHICDADLVRDVNFLRTSSPPLPRRLFATERAEAPRDQKTGGAKVLTIWDSAEFLFF